LDRLKDKALVGSDIVLATIVYVVDDDASFRVAIGRLLRLAGYEVEEYGSALDLLPALSLTTAVSCILLDIKMPGLSGPELQERLAAQGAAPPIVFLSGHGDIATSVRAIKAGAEDFLTKPVSTEALLAAVGRAVARHQITLQQLASANAWRARLDKLTPREREVFGLVVRGKMNKQIANELGATERTIKAHRRRVMEKLDAGSFAELVAMAERLGVLAP
jgi:FixJ family two-component response regulator